FCFSETQIFFVKGLDSRLSIESAREIRVFAHVILQAYERDGAPKSHSQFTCRANQLTALCIPLHRAISYCRSAPQTCQGNLDEHPARIFDRRNQRHPLARRACRTRTAGGARAWLAGELVFLAPPDRRACASGFSRGRTRRARLWRKRQAGA